jgi:hypothetical protein
MKENPSANWENHCKVGINNTREISEMQRKPTSLLCLGKRRNSPTLSCSPWIPLSKIPNVPIVCERRIVELNGIEEKVKGGIEKRKSFIYLVTFKAALALGKQPLRTSHSFAA